MGWMSMLVLGIAAATAQPASASDVGDACDTPVVTACPGSFSEGILIYYPRNAAGEAAARVK